MKKNLFYYAFALSLIISIPLTSCGDDNEKDEPSSNTGLSKEVKAFVGYWVAEEGTSAESWNQKYSDLLLYDDGTCVTSMYKCEYGLDYDNWNSINHGIWTYDSSTRLLSNSANERTYEVMRIDDKSMLCIDILTRETIEFSKKNNELRAAQLALAGNWVSATGDSILIPLDEWEKEINSHIYAKPIYLSSSMLATLKTFLNSTFNWHIDDPYNNYIPKLETTDELYTYKYYMVTCWRYNNNFSSGAGCFDGKIIIDNMFSPKNQIITFKDHYIYTTFKGTFYKKDQAWELNHWFFKL